VAVARAHVWWSVALLVVPAVLAGLALLWVGRQEQAPPPGTPARGLPAGPSAPAVATVPVDRPTHAGVTEPLGRTVDESGRGEITTG